MKKLFRWTSGLLLIGAGGWLIQTANPTEVFGTMLAGFGFVILWETLK